MVADGVTKDVFAAPCSIPRTMQKLILPKSSSMDFPTGIETKMLIVPDPSATSCTIRDLDEYTCELTVPNVEVTCLQHLIQQRQKVSILSEQLKGADHAAQEDKERTNGERKNSDELSVYYPNVSGGGSIIYISTDDSDILSQKRFE
ncbi:hypothetical protein MTP99_002312 [Tenebrio molitor]|nr:hypothetical protein MTP99_002312 [Tenebrio molitor]